ncbi:MAG: patatin-like phospholipase family protein [Pseudomonadota bacterium]
MRFSGKKTIKSVFKTKLIAVSCLAVIAACASRPQENVEIRTLVPTEAIDPIGPQLPTATQIDDDNHHTVLALSAGGADGAFGAGVMAGWTKSGTRPKFDVVTGVSTGSLLAVLAFLGPEYDGLAQEVYTTQTNDSIFRSRGLGGVFGDSLYDNGPLKEQIERHVTNEMLAKIAVEHQKGRRLYVATTNLDAGQLVIWDMGKIALGGRSNPLQHFQKILRASAAVPGFFQPVYIKPKRGVQLRQAHVDGGVKEPVLYANFMAQSRASKKSLYMVINGTTKRFNASVPVKPNLASIAQKTIFELMREIQSDTIFRQYSRAKINNTEFYITSIPDSFPVPQQSLNFDPVRMNSIYAAGFEIGSKGVDAWQRKPRSILREEGAQLAEVQQ